MLKKQAFLFHNNKTTFLKKLSLGKRIRSLEKSKLNTKDLETDAYSFTVRWYDGFDAWFVLQYFRRDRPFLTKVGVSKSLTHNDNWK